MKKKRQNKIERYHEVFTEIYFLLFIISFAFTFFYIDPSITGFSTFQFNVADTVSPNVTVNSPANNSNISYTNVTFSILVGDDNANITNVSIFGNWTGTYQINSTNSSVALANNNTLFSINITQGRGFYLWAVRACDNSSNCNSTTNQTLFINRLPEITSINISNDQGANKTAGNLNTEFNFLDPDSDSNAYNETRWYNNSVEITAFKNFTQIHNANTTTGDTWILSARVQDGENWSAWYNSSSHSIQNNAAPNFTGTIGAQTWDEDFDRNNAFDLDDFFIDAEGDALTYKSIGTRAIAVSIASTGVVSFTQPKDWNGIEYVVFNATDSNFSRFSNNVSLTVTPLQEQALVSEEGGGINRKHAAIGILAPSNKDVFLKDKVIIPIDLKNTGTASLQGIKLSVSSSESKVKATIDKQFIPSLSQGAQEKIVLEIETALDQEKKNIEISIEAQVNSPSISDSAKIYLNAIEFGASNKSVIVPRMNYAKDLFSQNPECAQLNELIDRAEGLFKQEQFNEAQNLIDQAINGCNDIALLEPKKLGISKKGKLTQNLILFGELFVFLSIMISFVVYYKKRREKYIRGF